ncbi:UbiA-like protein EboC [Runella salmonicolor]|uniref:UbiA-like protein EboC n=1 Tax=Runella salmonicolor TaxID=2950278 RepID=A0ABT1FUH1_9BACT|nr:UbiA-like protein EboC [Runella salmonicolor]MCP1385425.1 UbiA-like protein EboC [Runella salmonicolor]
MSVIKPYLQLTRPANIVTAIADILAGMAIAQFTFGASPAYWLVLSTVGLYGGGVVMNDVFDAQLDAIERPERPIPSGRVPIRSAAFMGLGLLILGVVSAALFSILSGMIALIVALLAILYDRYAKHSAVFGPLTMGFCRGGNLLLGMSAVSPSLPEWGWLALVPIAYIGAITLISQDEVHGGKRRSLYIAASLYTTVHAIQFLVAFNEGNGTMALLLIVLHALMVGRPLWNAFQNPIGPNIGKAVKAGVLSLIVMNAAWCIAFGNWPVALGVLLLLPLSILLARIFAVT